MSTNPWAPERDEAFRKLYEAGEAMGSIAKLLKTSTRTLTRKTRELNLAREPKTWTPEVIDTLKRLKEDGKSSSAIAREIGAVTRNAVIGKAYRLGLKPAHRPSPGALWRKRVALRIKRADAKPILTEPVRTKAQTLDDNRLKMHALRSTKTAEIVDLRPAKNAPIPKMLTLQQLTGATCRWPLGHPGDGGFGFCGLIPKTASVYCNFHHAIAYVKEDPRKRRAA